jgi:N-acyl-D-aspartate/D-glutamate deacylase
MRPLNRLLIGLLAVLPFLLPSAVAAYELVLRGGRIVDPANGRDLVADLAIDNGRVAAVSEEALPGDRVIDVGGLVVAPGFIDLHSHSPTPAGQSFQALDGVTTALELEAGAFPVTALDPLLPGGGRIHYGASVSHLAIRMQVLANHDQAHLLIPGRVHDPARPHRLQDAFTRQADEAEMAAMRALLREGLRDGGLGIGLLVDYLSAGITAAELAMVFDVAAEFDAPVFAHIRRGLPGDSAGLEELLVEAERSGAALHVCHLNASAMQGVAHFLQLMAAARERGVRVTSEVYPYNAGSTQIGAAVFGRDWQAIFGIDYGDIEWSATGERLTAESFAHYRATQPGGEVIHHYGREDWVLRALEDRQVFIASDAMPMPEPTTRVHPRGIGTFSRTLSRYGRDADAEAGFDLAALIDKMSAGPARALTGVAPVFARKGQLGVGADADITVFDPVAIDDRATYRAPLRHSVGVRYLLVGGVPVVENGSLLEGARPGHLLLGKAAGR